jgi:hypothetical protein
LVKLLFTLITLAAMLLAGRRYYSLDAGVPLVSFTLSLLFSSVHSRRIEPISRSQN